MVDVVATAVVGLKGTSKNDRSCISKSSKVTSEVGQVRPRASSYNEYDENEGTDGSWEVNGSWRACKATGAGERPWVKDKGIVMS